MNRLDQAAVALQVGFVATAAWTAYDLVSAGLEEGLMASFILSLVPFMLGSAYRRGYLVLYAWVWMAANFIAAQSSTVSASGYIVVLCGSVFLLVAIDSFQFLDYLSPADRSRRAPGESQDGLRWSLMKRHASLTLAVGLFAGASVWAGIAFSSPVLVPSDPILLVGAAVAGLLLVAALLASK